VVLRLQSLRRRRDSQYRFRLEIPITRRGSAWQRTIVGLVHDVANDVPEGGLALSSRERHRILTVPEELLPWVKVFEC
jgi:hypothetical protein